MERKLCTLQFSGPWSKHLGCGGDPSLLLWYPTLV